MKNRFYVRSGNITNSPIVLSWCTVSKIVISFQNLQLSFFQFCQSLKQTTLLINFYQKRASTKLHTNLHYDHPFTFLNKDLWLDEYNWIVLLSQYSTFIHTVVMRLGPLHIFCFHIFNSHSYQSREAFKITILLTGERSI